MKHARSDYDRIQDPAGLIPEDEPVFLLRAKDRIAPLIVSMWAAELERQGGDPDMVDAAQLQSERMRSWQSEHGEQLPDAPPGTLWLEP